MIIAFLCEFKQRLIDCYLQGWNSDINSKDRYAFFSSFKQTHGLSQYLLTVKNVALKRNLVGLGVSFLWTETWCVLFETALPMFFKNNTGEL